jgi:hypothetical protein
MGLGTKAKNIKADTQKILMPTQVLMPIGLIVGVVIFSALILKYIIVFEGNKAKNFKANNVTYIE